MKNDTSHEEWRNPLMESVTGIVQRIKSLTSSRKSMPNLKKVADGSNRISRQTTSSKHSINALKNDDRSKDKINFDSQGIVNVNKISN